MPKVICITMSGRRVSRLERGVRSRTGYHNLRHPVSILSSMSGISDVLTNVALPTTSATLTLRIIKSFEYRTERSLVLHGLNLETTTAGELKNIARQVI